MNSSVQESIYNEYYSKVFGYIRTRINNPSDVEDLVSAVFLKVINAYDSFDPSKASVSTWIYTISQNVVRDHLRKFKVRSAHDGDPDALEAIPFIDENSNGDSLIREEELESLAAALEQLSERERNIIILRYYKEYKVDLVAEMLSLSSANVRFISHSALTKLRKIMS